MHAPPEPCRKIIHIDMDAFYASVEQRDNPSLKGKPIAVGGSAEGRGVVAAASYEARPFGVRSALATKIALQRCPNLQLVKPRFNVYKQVSNTIHQIFKNYTHLIEPLSLDEAYLDVTENLKNQPSASILAQQIREEILEKTGLTASAGISYNKFLAKIASDENKPNGQFVITPHQGIEFLEQLAIEKFYGIGKATSAKMHKLGIKTSADLKQKKLEWLTQHFGKTGQWYWHIVRGEDHRPVSPNRLRKSLGVEDTFSQDVNTLEELSQKLDAIILELKSRLKKRNFKGRTLTLKVKYSNFKSKTLSITPSEKTLPWNDIDRYAFNLLQQTPDIKSGIRLLGLSLSNPVLLDEQKAPIHQLSLPFQK